MRDLQNSVNGIVRWYIVGFGFVATCAVGHALPWSLRRRGRRGVLGVRYKRLDAPGFLLFFLRELLSSSSSSLLLYHHTVLYSLLLLRRQNHRANTQAILFHQRTFSPHHHNHHSQQQQQKQIMPLHLTEPHPSPASYMPTGRGGAGNYRSTASTPLTPHGTTYTYASGASIPYPASSTNSKHFTSGRGGAGNVHQASERAIFSFDEELERLRRGDEGVAPVYHIGRGGAGNLVDVNGVARRNGSIASSGSESSERGVGRKSVEWVRDRLGRNGSGRS